MVRLRLPLTVEFDCAGLTPAQVQELAAAWTEHVRGQMIGREWIGRERFGIDHIGMVVHNGSTSWSASPPRRS